MKDEATSVCEECGASVYKEHVDSGIARYEDGKLMCSYCVAEFEKSHDSSVGASSDELEPIAFKDEDDDEVDMSQSRIHLPTDTMLGSAGKWDESQYKRPIDPKGDTASRCRIFHTKLTDSAVIFMTNTINEWLDANPTVSIKFATSTIGVVEGKHPEPHLIMTLFY